MRMVVLVALALLCSSCVQQETVRFQAKAQQQAFVRDGRPALVSQKANSIVLIRPAARQIAAGGRPVFVVGIRNLTKSPVDFIVRNVAVTQVAGAQTVALKVFSYEELVAEERTRQVVEAVLVGAVAGLNSAAASQGGYSNRTTTRYTATGPHTSYTTSYSSLAATNAQNRAFRQNEKMTDAAIAEGQANLAILERDVIKDNTLMPGEWYGGTLHVAAPSRDADGPRTYTIAMMVGADRHDINIVQEAAP
ncbi:MAG: hypothetical protein QOD40_3330 [Alphaproteobacteria bacterium]|nr:hypothetical protein [Alphaproteobacteria bacterium]